MGQALSPRFRYKSGFFVQGDVTKPIPVSNPPRMGLLEGKTWQDVQAVVDAKRLIGLKMKLLLFLRHGEGTHNVAIAQYGSEAWNSYYCKLPEFLDAPLTSKGIEQAKESSTKLNKEIKNGLHIEHVLISPLERALRTFTIAYQDQSNISSKPLELPREILGVDTCDERRSISEKALQYPELDFSGFSSNLDPWWTPDHRESESEVEARANKFLDMVFTNISAGFVGVVSHSVFCAALLRVIDHREYSLGTAEFLPLLIHERTSAN
ncbi:unnamed protein product [Phytophthora fragariaefolia]|uniref:Unnamed protein product n=1 Tax=Phytophthora fragariaefolia TaxID=1490495 RepID=A0A9W6WWE0_9STRA|nr:unnamed protein product [Phytophthora fragariaefolia]